MTIKSNNHHWNTIFSQAENSKLGWYEQEASQTLKLLSRVPEWRGSTIFLPGVGTSVLIDELLNHDARLILNDISNEALSQVKTRLGEISRDITYLCQDIAQPLNNLITQIVDVWIDRAVLHFLLDESDIEGYFDNVKSTLKIGGYAIFAEFSETGATRCAG
ncbi:MAG: class I SAM-dependent methyltransferase, partial [Gammaproteobacteria bacterium]|nr:class I SAM-dependent methyltransferase [Gammaproteobacteria bacterium]